MSSIIPKNLIDDLYIHKYNAANKMRQIMDVAEEYEEKGMIKTASSGSSGSSGSLGSSGQIDKTSLINLFTVMLSTLNMTANEGDLKDIIGKIAKNDKIDKIDKQASINKNSKERKDDIKIVSKHIKDSHYQVDVSKDIIKQNGKEVFMVSCYAKDAYLGRYLIKRNYFYTIDREKFANNAYDEIMTKISSIKDRYYNDVIDVSGIFTQIKQALDGVISEIEMKEDSIGTNVKR